MIKRPGQTHKKMDALVDARGWWGQNNLQNSNLEILHLNCIWSSTLWIFYVKFFSLFQSSATSLNNQFDYEQQTPSRRVKATALRSPLQLSAKEIHFSLPSGYFDLNVESYAGRTEVGDEYIFVHSSWVGMCIQHLYSWKTHPMKFTKLLHRNKGL